MSRDLFWQQIVFPQPFTVDTERSPVPTLSIGTRAREPAVAGACPP